MTVDPLPPDFASEVTFEQAYQELESIVIRLEAGSLSLDESLKLFERGQQLAAWCDTQLDAAELRVSQLSEDGKPSLGVLTLFNDNGTREEEEEYAGGVIDGHVRQYYPDGSIQAIWEYSKGVREGVAIGWHRTGALEFCWFYRADVLSGRFQSFFSDGKTMSLGAMKEGKKIGDWIDYHDNGVVAMKAIYGPDGSLVGTAQSFDKTGAEIKKKQKNNP